MWDCTVLSSLVQRAGEEYNYFNFMTLLVKAEKHSGFLCMACTGHTFIFLCVCVCSSISDDSGDLDKQVGTCCVVPAD